MSVKKILMTAMVLAIFAVSLAAAADTSDGYIGIDEEKTNGDGFSNNSNGTVHVHFNSEETVDVYIDIRVEDSDGKLLAEKKDVRIPAGADDYVVDVSVGLSGVGTHEIKVICTPEMYFLSAGGITFNFVDLHVEVTESLWSKWTTYLAIAVVVILIVIAIFLRMRSASDKNPDTTFTELENKRRSPAKSEPTAAASTERKRYKADDAPAKEVPKSEAKKAESFTELEKRKTEPPKAEPVKESKKPEAPKEKPKAESKSEAGEKKLKYTSARRK
ncbi:MAG: hypothetical protein LBT41_03815 [Candidatus Methanoplasma sp.]|jgi:hypothetical protein|nr:hypothetical protein [Candidatus Methanoplasma sp.]